MADEHPTKRCPQCKLVFPLTDEYFRFDKKTGLPLWCCRDCKKKSNRKHRRKQQEQLNALKPLLLPGHKHCSVCKIQFPATDDFFYLDNRGHLGSTCKSCNGKKSTAYHRKRVAGILIPRPTTTIIDGQQRCLKCNNTFLATTEFFALKPERKEGINSRCIECVKRSERERYWRNKELLGIEPRPEVPDGYKRCPLCTRVLPLTTNYFYATKIKASGFYHRCIDCARERAAADFKVGNGPIRNRLARLRRRARRRNLPDDFTDADWEACLAYWGYACAVCGNQERLMSPDHWIPFYDQANCPGNVPKNIIPLCWGRGGCNNSKKARESVKWLVARVGPEVAEEILKAIQQYFAQARQHQIPQKA